MKYNFNTWRPHQEKTFRVIIRGLVISTDLQDLQDELQDKGLTIKQTLQLRSKNKTLMPLFLVELPANKRNKSIYTLTKLLSQRVSVEPERRQGPPICTRCLSFAHLHAHCQKRPRCGVCGQGHLMADCPNSFEAPKCANCGGPHKGVWKGCPSYQKFINPPNQVPASNQPTPNQKPTSTGTSTPTNTSAH